MLKKKKKIPQGSILIEAMAATVILSLVMVASTTPILMSIVTRLQSEHVSQSVQLAQQEIDKMREVFATGYSLGTTSTAYTSADLPAVAYISGSPALRSNISSVSAPTSICTNNCTYTQGKIVTLTSNAGYVQQFLVQTFSSQQMYYSAVPGYISGATTTAASQPIAFRMGVRVYAGEAITALNNGLSLSNTQANSSIGLSSNQTPQSKAPLAVIYADFVNGNLTLSSQAYSVFVNGTY